MNEMCLISGVLLNAQAFTLSCVEKTNCTVVFHAFIYQKHCFRIPLASYRNTSIMYYPFQHILINNIHLPHSNMYLFQTLQQPNLELKSGLCWHEAKLVCHKLQGSLERLLKLALCNKLVVYL